MASTGMRSTSAVGHGADRRQAAAALERRDLALQRARPDARERDLAAPGPLRDLELAVEDDVERVGLVSLADEPLARRQVDDLAHLDQPVQLLVVEAAEQRRGAQPLGDRRAREGAGASQLGEVLVDELAPPSRPRRRRWRCA